MPRINIPMLAKDRFPTGHALDRQETSEAAKIIYDHIVTTLAVERKAKDVYRQNGCRHGITHGERYKFRVLANAHGCDVTWRERS